MGSELVVDAGSGLVVLAAPPGWPAAGWAASQRFGFGEAFDLALGLRMVCMAVSLRDAQAGEQVFEWLRPPVKPEV